MNKQEVIDFSLETLKEIKYFLQNYIDVGGPEHDALITAMEAIETLEDLI